jgi:hypothetical protein
LTAKGCCECEKIEISLFKNENMLGILKSYQLAQIESPA